MRNVLDGSSKALYDLTGDGTDEMQAEYLLRCLAHGHGLQVAVTDVALRDEELRWLVELVVDFDVLRTESKKN